MGVLDKLFGSDKQLDKLTTGAVNGLDKMFFTQEEKSEASQKLSEWYLRYLEATAPQGLARRFIAVVVVLLWCALIIAGVTIRWWSYEASDFIFKVLEEIIMTPFSIILGFYFLTHAVRAYKK